MTEQRRKSINFNHISDKLTEKQIEELKILYKSYHRLYICYQMKYKRSKRILTTLELLSVSLTTTGAIIGSVTLNPIILGTVSGAGVLLQSFSNLRKNMDRCKFAYQAYEHITIQLKSYLRGLPYDRNIFLSDVKVIDDFVIDLCPPIDKYISKYNSQYY